MNRWVESGRDDTSPTRRSAIASLRTITAVSLLVLMIATWPLWWPGPASDYPMIPWPIVDRILGGIGVDSPDVIGRGATLLTMAASVLVLLRDSGRYWACVLIGLVIGFAVDQQRLQPWAYQQALFALAFATIPPASHRAASAWPMRSIVISIYFYSAVGKLDFQFTHTVGQQFLQALLTPIGGIPGTWTETTRVLVASAIPLCELSIAFGLMVGRTRRFAGIAAMGLHLGLIAILGPWALSHSLGVLLWNVAMIAQAFVLFVHRPPQVGAHVRPADEPAGRIATAAWVVFAAAMLMPMLERRGYWDHWLSWSLYSPHTSRVEVQVAAGRIDDLPPSLRRHVRAATDDPGWREVSMSNWSLARRRVPIYPQSRYQLQLIAKVAGEADLKDDVRGIVKGIADRRSGVRRQRRWIGLKELQRTDPL